MTIYTPTELIEQMQKRIARGMYRPDQKMVVTIWVGDDARSGPDNDRRVSEETWTRFCNHINRGLYEGQLEDAQASLLHEWLTDWEAKQA
jgi:hypothetical protein